MPIFDLLNKNKEKLLKKFYKIFSCKIKDIAVNFMWEIERYNPDDSGAKRFVLSPTGELKILPERGSNIVLEKYKELYSIMPINDLKYFLPLDSFAKLIVKPLLEDFIPEEELAKQINKAERTEDYIKSQVKDDLERILMDKRKVASIKHYVYKVMFPSPKMFDIVGPDFSRFKKLFGILASKPRRVTYYQTGKLMPWDDIF